MIEEKLGLESYFEKERFGQREDGFYCLKAPTKVKLTIENWVKNFITNFIRTKNYPVCQASRELQGSARRKCPKKQIKNWKIFMLISIKNLLIFIERNSVGCHEIKKITYFLRLFKIQLWPISLIGGSWSGIFRLIAHFFFDFSVS